DHAGRLLRPGSRMVVLADAASVAAVPASRWPALSMHSEVIVLLLGDPLERDPPRAPLPFATPTHRVELDLGVAAQRQRWRQEFVEPVEAALPALPPRRVRVHLLSSDAPSESRLPSLARPRAAWWRCSTCRCAISTSRRHRRGGRRRRAGGGSRRRCSCWLRSPCVGGCARGGGARRSCACSTSACAQPLRRLNASRRCPNCCAARHD